MQWSRVESYLRVLFPQSYLLLFSSAIHHWRANRPVLNIYLFIPSFIPFFVHTFILHSFTQSLIQRLINSSVDLTYPASSKGKSLSPEWFWWCRISDCSYVRTCVTKRQVSVYVCMCVCKCIYTRTDVILIFTWTLVHNIHIKTCITKRPALMSYYVKIPGCVETLCLTRAPLRISWKCQSRSLSRTAYTVRLRLYYHIKCYIVQHEVISTHVYCVSEQD